MSRHAPLLGPRYTHWDLNRLPHFKLSRLHAFFFILRSQEPPKDLFKCTQVDVRHLKGIGSPDCVIGLQPTKIAVIEAKNSTTPSDDSL